MNWMTRSSCSRAKASWQEPVVGGRAEGQEAGVVGEGPDENLFSRRTSGFSRSSSCPCSAVSGASARRPYISTSRIIFPDEVGVVGGMVGVIGGLGGFFCPIIFGYLLETTGLWTSCWMFMWVISVSSACSGCTT